MALPKEVSGCLSEARSALVALEACFLDAQQASEDRAAERRQSAQAKIDRLERQLDDRCREVDVLKAKVESLYARLREATGGRDNEGRGDSRQRQRSRSRSRSRSRGQGELDRGRQRAQERERGNHHMNRSPKRRSRSRASRGRRDKDDRRSPTSDRSQNIDGRGGEERGRDGSHDKMDERGHSEDRAREGRSTGDDGMPWRTGSGTPRSQAQAIEDGPMEAEPVALCIPYVMGSCKNGDECALRHPDEDNCRQALMSLKKKVCRYGAECKRQDCIFIHEGRGRSGPDNGHRNPSGNSASWSGTWKGSVGSGTPSSAQRDRASSTPCRYGADCRRPDCKFLHDNVASVGQGGQSSGVGQAQGQKKAWCRYGAECRRSDCGFRHS